MRTKVEAPQPLPSPEYECAVWHHPRRWGRLDRANLLVSNVNNAWYNFLATVTLAPFLHGIIMGTIAFLIVSGTPERLTIAVILGVSAMWLSGAVLLYIERRDRKNHRIEGAIK